MILLDFNPVMISNIMGNIRETGNNSDFNEDLVRHQILNSIRIIHNKFKHDYAEMVICYDSSNYWRKKIFPYYKASRKKHRDNSLVDWAKLFLYFDKIKLELKEVLPYKILEIETAEADDIIGHLCKMYCIHDNIMIVSGDKDFIQLHGPTVKQYDPIHKKAVKSDLSPQEFLTLHILQGDTSDGVPNHLSPDDCFVTGTRQRPLTKKRIEEWKAGDVNQILVRNFKRNQQLVDFAFIPEEIKAKIKDEYDTKPTRDRQNLLKYFVKNRLNRLLEDISDF